MSNTSKSLVELAANRSRMVAVRAIETAVKRMEDAAQEARRELRHIEKMDSQELMRLVSRLLSMAAFSHANIVSGLTDAITGVAEQHHAEGMLEAAKEAEKLAAQS